MQEMTCDGVPVAKLSTVEIEEHISRIYEVTFRDTDGVPIEEARAALLKRLELEIRIRNMGLR